MACCPNCTAQIQVEVPQCPKCGADFSSASSWRPIPESPAEADQLSRIAARILPEPPAAGSMPPVVRERISHGRLDFPGHLLKELPFWLRHWNWLTSTPLAIAAIIALEFEFIPEGVVLLTCGLLAILPRFWMARAALLRKGLWRSGAWYATYLPRFHRWQTAFLLLILVAAIGSYLFIGYGIRIQALTAATIAAWALIPPVYVMMVLDLDFIGSDFGYEFANERPGYFMLGLLTYAFVIGLLALLMILWIVKTD